MRFKSFMLIAGETSGDMLAAELVRALRKELSDAEAISTPDYQPLHTSLEPRFFGAGGPRMAAEGVELAFDLTAHSVIGLSDALKNYLKFRRLFHQLLEMAFERQPDAIICVDFSGFNRRFAHAIKQHARTHSGWFHDWSPRIIQYVSPQVWASREDRAYQMARDYDLLLSIFPFEKEWYAKKVPQLPVEFIGHPIIDRHLKAEGRGEKAEPSAVASSNPHTPASPVVLLLPGSRISEVKRHLPVMLGALEAMRDAFPNLRARMVLPDDALLRLSKGVSVPASMEIQTGGLPAALAGADVAIASTGTVTLECASFGLPTVAIYKTSWTSYQIGRHLVKVKYLAMPNLLVNEEIMPEFIQEKATPENIARAAIELLRDESRRAKVKAKLAEVVVSLGEAGASGRAARAIVQMVAPEREWIRRDQQIMDWAQPLRG